MLTDNEKRWLQLRKLYEGVTYLSYYSCMHCPEYNIERWFEYKYPCNMACLHNGCPFIDIRSSGTIFDYVEAAEFEQRVTTKLANVFQHINDYWVNLPCDACPQEGKCDMDCNDSILKWARLQVEEEMDADS